MKIANLNHLETVADAQVQGGFGFVKKSLSLTGIKFDAFTKIDLEDNVATADAEAIAVDEKTFTSTHVTALSDDYYSYSSSSAVSISD
jgi:hypothetical protein